MPVQRASWARGDASSTPWRALHGSAFSQKTSPEELSARLARTIATCRAFDDRSLSQTAAV